MMTAELEASHAFEKFRLGLLAQCLLVDAERLNNAVYDSQRYQESVPYTHKYTVSVAPDDHRQHWLKLTLFAEF